MLFRFVLQKMHLCLKLHSVGLSVKSGSGKDGIGCHLSIMVICRGSDAAGGMLSFDERRPSGGLKRMIKLLFGMIIIIKKHSHHASEGVWL